MTKIARPSHRTLARGVLDRTTWLQVCSAATLDEFVASGRVVLLDAGDAIVRRGETVDSLCVVVDGNLEIGITDMKGNRHVAGYLEVGQIMNLIPVLDDHVAIHDARAHGDCTVLLISKSVFVAAIEREPRLSRSLLRLLCLRSRNIYDLLADNALSSLRSRCARALLILIPSHGRPYEKGIEISLKLSQQEFADMVGTTRQSVNREIRRLEEDGVIRTSYSQFVVLDPSRLHRIASEAL